MLWRVYFYSHRLDELDECAGEALCIAQELGDERLGVETMVFIAMRQDIVGELAEAKWNLDEIIRVARGRDYRRALLDGLAWRGQLYFFQSEYECALEVLAGGPGPRFRPSPWATPSSGAVFRRPEPRKHG